MKKWSVERALIGTYRRGSDAEVVTQHEWRPLVQRSRQHVPLNSNVALKMSNQKHAVSVDHILAVVGAGRKSASALRFFVDELWTGTRALNR